MRICAIVKYPPIQGGVAAQTYWMCQALAAAGHEVFVVTNADEVEPEYRIRFFGDDEDRLQARFPDGGSVRVRSAHEWDARQYAHVPAGNPAAAKLAAMATEVVREHDCDVIVAFYLEPYGVAANLASAWTGRPFVVRHAGSDRYRLMTHPDLGLAYKEVLRAASGVLSAGTDLSGFGIPAERVLTAPGSYTPALFTPDAAPLDLNALVSQLSAEGFPGLLNVAMLTEDLPKLGIYGKFGPTKGTLDLLRTVALLRETGTCLQLVMLGGGTGWPAVEAAIRELGIADITWRLPFVAPWRVPGFIRACDVIGFLEHGFAIKAHRPGIPAEVMACGTPMILSREIAEKQSCAEDLVDGRNYYLIADPADHEALASVIRRAIADRAESQRVGLAATALVERLSDDEVGAGYEQALAACIGLAAHSRAADHRAADHRAADCHAGDRWVGDLQLAGSSFRHELDSLLRSRCPAIAQCVRDRLPELLDQAVKVQAAQPTSALLAAYRLCADAACMQSCGAAGPVSQLCAIERNLLWFDVDDEGIGGIAAFGMPVQTMRRLPAADSQATDLLRPVVTRLIRTERLTIDARQYAKAIKEHVAGRPVGAALPVPAYTAIFHKFAHLGGTIYQVDERTEQLLAACSGRLNLAEIMSAVGAEGPSRDRVLRLVQEMLDCRLLAIAAGPVSAASPAGHSPG
jgi:glycosyltransferase involved in cell wall biosynthesis